MKYILIIDDDKWYSESISNVLNEYKVTIANTPDEAMQVIDKNIPFMIYLDLNLGARNGMTILNELQSWIDTRSVPIVLLHSDGKRLDINDWKKYGVVRILDKSQTTPEKIRESVIYGKSSH
jgi:CheY-like chemotaxis protein